MGRRMQRHPHPQPPLLRHSPLPLVAGLQRDVERAPHHVPTEGRVGGPTHVPLPKRRVGEAGVHQRNFDGVERVVGPTPAEDLGWERRQSAALRCGGEGRNRDSHPRPPVRVGALDLPTVGVDDHDAGRRLQLKFNGAVTDLEREAQGGRSKAVRRCSGGRRRWRGNVERVELEGWRQRDGTTAGN